MSQTQAGARQGVIERRPMHAIGLELAEAKVRTSQGVEVYDVAAGSAGAGRGIQAR